MVVVKKRGIKRAVVGEEEDVEGEEGSCHVRV